MNLTEDEILLLAHIAGGFNYNRVGVPYSIRFPASVSWLNADALNRLVERITEQPPPPVGVVDLGTIYPGGSPTLFGANPGQVYSATIGGDGKVNWSVSSGNMPCYASTDATFPSDESKTKYGSGTTDPLTVVKGQVVYLRHDGDTPQNARVSMI